MVNVSFTAGIRNDWQSRDVFDFAWESGVLYLTDDQAGDLWDDLDHYGDPCSTDMDRSTRLIYARAKERLRRAIHDSGRYVKFIPDKFSLRRKHDYKLDWNIYNLIHGRIYEKLSLILDELPLVALIDGLFYLICDSTVDAALVTLAIA